MIVGGLAAFLLTGCAPIVDTRGNLPTQDRLSAVKPGRSTREDVSSVLGTPSSTSVFGDETWFYISSKTETFAFFEPTVLERKVVAVDFDPKGTVKGVRMLDEKDAREIQMVTRETPSAGKELGLLEQLIGNIGRFSDDAPTTR